MGTQCRLVCQSLILKYSYCRTSIKRPPSMKRPLLKVSNYLIVNCCIGYHCSMATSIERLLPPFCCSKVITYCFKWPAILKCKPCTGHVNHRSTLTEHVAQIHSFQDLALSIGKANDLIFS